jgi:hypothetical protein
MIHKLGAYGWRIGGSMCESGGELGAVCVSREDRVHEGKRIGQQIGFLSQLLGYGLWAFMVMLAQ